MRVSAAEAADMDYLFTMRSARSVFADYAIGFIAAAGGHFRGLVCGVASAGSGAFSGGGDFRIESPPVLSSMRARLPRLSHKGSVCAMPL